MMYPFNGGMSYKVDSDLFLESRRADPLITCNLFCKSNRTLIQLLYLFNNFSNKGVIFLSHKHFRAVGFIGDAGSSKYANINPQQ
jgi:hypothetical protein